MTDNFFTVPARSMSAGAIKPFRVEWWRYLRIYWTPGRRYSAQDAVRSQTVTGFAFVALQDGEAGLNEPSWPRKLAGTVADGSIIWQAVAPDDIGVDPIVGTPLWEQIAPPDDALSIPIQLNTIDEVSVSFEGGTAGQTYRIKHTIATESGQRYILGFDLEVN
jgi:hypothetical protein